MKTMKRILCLLLVLLSVGGIFPAAVLADFVEGIDVQSKVLTVTLPEGLLEGEK